MHACTLRKVMCCPANGCACTPLKLALGISLLLLALLSIVLTSSTRLPVSNPSVVRISFARNFLKKAAGTATTDPEAFEPNENSWASNVVYISNTTLAEKLSCPVDHSLACFYSFVPKLPELPGPSEGNIIGEGDCTFLFKPLPADRGRSWCIRQGKEPPWLQEEIQKGHSHEITDPVLLTGELDGPNPTHQVNLHFYAIWLWMQKNNIVPGKLNMLVDSSNPAWSPGKYGTGIGNALGTVQWLPQLPPGVYHFQKIQFSVPDGQTFPFDLKRHTIDAKVDLKYLEFAETVKIRSGCRPHKLLATSALHTKEVAFWAGNPCKASRSRPTVVLAQRSEPESRVWGNIHELASHLRQRRDLEVKVVAFGKLDFAQQVQIAATADVLVGLTGSDLVNLIFLPLTGAIVEVFPYLEHEGIFVPELGNLASLVGKNHFIYAAEGNVTLDESQPRLLFKIRSVDVAVEGITALIRHAVHQATSGSVLDTTSCAHQGAAVRCSNSSPA